MDKKLKKALSVFTSLPLSYLGMQRMSDSTKVMGPPSFSTKKHQSNKVPRRGFYKPISKF